MKWRKGQAEILTTTMLIAVSVIASSFVFAAIQPQNYIPVADEPSILEKIDVVQVVRVSESSIMVGILNTGGYDAVIDSIYVMDSNHNLVKTYRVDRALPVDAMMNVELPISGSDASKWIVFEAVTKRGNSDSLVISTPVDLLPGSTRDVAANLLNVTINGVPIISPSELARLREVDYDYLNTTSQIKTYAGSDSLAIANQTLQLVNGDWSTATVGTDPKYDLHLQMKDNKGVFIFSGKMTIIGVLYQLRCNVTGYLPSGSGYYNASFTFYNYLANRWASPGESGFIQANNIPIVDGGQNNVKIMCNINEAWKYVDPATGNWSFMLNISSGGNPSNFKINSSNIRLMPLYLEDLNGLFMYNITQPSDLTKIQSLSFNVTNFCNVSSMQFLIKIFNHASNGWDVMGAFTTSVVPFTPANFYGSVAGDVLSYIGSDRKVIINIIPANFMGEPFATSFDLARLVVTHGS